MNNLKYYLYDDTKIPESQDVIITIDETKWLTKNNISFLVGKPKSRKSTVGLGIMIAHQTGEEVFNFKVKGGGKCVYIDTEQTPYQCYNSIKRIKGYHNLDKLDTEKANIYLFRMLSCEEIIDKIEFLISTDADIKLLILDSITDMVNDINNILEAKWLMGKLKKWSNSGIAIVSLLHLGRINAFALGHIGAAAERSCESMAVVTKESTDVYQTNMKSLYMRSDLDFDPYNIVFKGENYDIQEPLTKLSNKNIKPELIDIQIHKNHLSTVRALHQILSYGELTEVLKSHYGKGESYVKKELIPFLRTQGLLIQDNKRKYSVPQNIK